MTQSVSNKSWRLYGGALICALTPVLCLLPFLTRAFHIDDPLFLWTANHIQSHPLDFYGFDVNWDGFVKTMAHENKNPPLASYYLALVASLFGWSEPALHAGFLLPAAALGLGTFFLARRLCARAVSATLISVFTPALLVSASSVMSDVPMLALFVWSVVLWLRGIESENGKWLFAAGFLIAVTALTKYFGLALVPLLAVYTILRTRKMGSWMAALSVPILIIALYESFMWAHYGTGGLFNAAEYAGESQSLAGRLTSTLTGLAFMGGCLASVAFYLPLLRVRFLLPLVATIAIAMIAILVLLPGTRTLLGANGIELSWPVTIQVALFAAAGSIVPALAVSDLWRRRDAESTLLFLWVFGTFLFSAYLNWSVTVRTLLPMVPAAGILVVRRLETLQADGARIAPWKWYAPLVPALVLAMAVAWADAKLANSARVAAQQFGAEMVHYPFSTYFQGHWGFQYYMEAEGGKAVRYGKTDFQRGDAIINPLNNTSVWPIDESLVGGRFSGDFQGPRDLTTMSHSCGAGFYTDLWGPLPFVFGSVPPERYVTVVLNGAGTPFLNVEYHE